MSKQIIYLEDLPELRTSLDGQSGTREQERELDEVQDYLMGLFEGLTKTGSRQCLLPSIADLAQRLRTPRELLWQSLNRLKREKQVEIDYQSGYYGMLTYTGRG